jgi:hypothetical protein
LTIYLQLHRIKISYNRKSVEQKSSLLKGSRERMSPAESILCHKTNEVHLGADCVRPVGLAQSGSSRYLSKRLQQSYESAVN